MEYVTLVITLITIIITALMWFTTVRSLKQSIRQNENNIRVFQSEAMGNITASHRDLFLTLLREDKFTSIIAANEPVEQYRKKMVGSILINHCNSIFLYAQKSLIEDDDWVGLQNDIRDFYTWPAVRERWPEIRSFYSQEFQEFIDRLTVVGRMDMVSRPKL